jgi:hypothetical protein
MTEKDFNQWWDSQYDAMKALYDRDQKPSVDRINPDGPYSLDNIQVRERWDNVRESRRRPKRPVIGVNVRTKKQKRFASVTEAANFVDGHKSNIVAACGKENKTAHGWRWQYQGRDR